MTTPMDVLLNTVEWQEIGNPEDVAMADDGIPWATHSGVLHIGGIELRCYTLNTGERILNADDVEALFGVSSNVPHEGAAAALSRTLPLDVVVGGEGGNHGNV